jgi:hypothetical protein
VARRPGEPGELGPGQAGGGQLAVLAEERRPEETRVVGGDRHRDAGAEKGTDAPGDFVDRSERARRDVGRRADVEDDAPRRESPR